MTSLTDIAPVTTQAADADEWWQMELVKIGPNRNDWQIVVHSWYDDETELILVHRGPITECMVAAQRAIGIDRIEDGEGEA